MAFKPSLRAVLPPDIQESARAALRADPSSGTAMPWFVQVLAGFGAWLAALFLFIFLALLVSMEQEGPVAIGVGLVVTGVALMMRRQSDRVFNSQFALSLGLAGQAFFIYGMERMTEGTVPPCLATIALQALLFIVYPDVLQRFLSTLFAGLTLLYLLRDTLPLGAVDVALLGLAALTHALFLRQGTWQARSRGELVAPAAFGLVTTLFIALIFRSSLHDFGLDSAGEETSPLPPGLLTLGLAGVTLYSAVRVMQEAGARPEGAAGVTVFVALSLLALLTARTPGVIAAVGILMLGFHRRSPVLLGMAVVFLIGFGTRYYYALELTLLAKSLALLGSGLLMLGLRLFIARRFPLTGGSPR